MWNRGGGEVSSKIPVILPLTQGRAFLGLGLGVRGGVD